MNKYLGALGLCLLFVALRWNTFNQPLIRDEGEYAYAAQLLRHGLAPYENSFLQKPPMVAYSYAFADLLAPHVFWFPRALAYLFVAGATILLGLIARLEFGAGVAWSAVWLCTPMVLQPALEQFTANTEMFMLLPLMAAVALYVVARRGVRASLCWLVAGFMGAITFWYKYTSLPLLVFLFGAWALDEWRAHRWSPPFWRRLGFGLLGAVVASAAAVGWLLVRDSGRHLWECTVVFNRVYSSTSTFGLSGLWSRLKILWTYWWILFLLLGVVVVKPGARLWFWLGMFVAAWAATGASAHGHYYIVLAPFWALLAAVALHRLAAWLAAWRSWSPIWLGRALTAAVLLLVCRSQWPWLRLSPAVFTALRLSGVSAFPESATVAARVARLTARDDYVYVAGSEPQILYYAQRLSPTRFVIAYPLMIPSPLARGYQHAAIQDLQKRPPAVIVFAMSNNSWQAQRGSPPDFAVYLKELLARHYERVGGYVVEPDGGHWVEPLPDPEMPKASLLVLKRIR